ncbi:hypothetical protein HZ326_4560 [Fusarium oxysporum f. sp. albedinis]|nr:hypothetical protein HZ326_4560 [Fusarium oxysporum f. sp. albedinis]
MFLLRVHICFSNPGREGRWARPSTHDMTLTVTLTGSHQVEDKRDHCNGCTGYSTYTTANVLGKELHTAPKHSIS